MGFVVHLLKTKKELKDEIEIEIHGNKKYRLCLQK